jgi:hypothetical protein
MTTSQPLTQSHIQPTLFAGDFLAKTSAQQVNKPASNRALGLASFTNSSESFAWYSPDTSCWKTSQRSLLTDWTPFLESWPKQGLMRNGRAYRQVLWAPAIKEIGGGLLPTPTTQEWKRRGPNSSQQGLSNTENWASLPTPVARDWKGRSTRNGALPNSFVPTGGGTYLNPSFVEEMMGFPVGWTALKP